MNKVISSALVVASITGASLLAGASTYASTQNCVDATVKSNLVATISDHNTVTVTTKNNAPVCKEVTLYFDSYTMPATYNGKAFANNATATPQTKFDGTTITLKAGQSTAAKATIKLPACDNYQTDVYYGPEITTVGAAGHGSQWINGEINGHNPVNADGSLNNAMTLEKAASCTTTTTTTTTPETPATPAVTELASTGIRENVTILMGTVLAAGAYGITYFFNKKRASNL